MLDSLLLDLKPLWPAAIGLILVLAIGVSLPVSDPTNVWRIFFALGTVLPAVLAVVVGLGAIRLPPSLVQWAKWLGLLLSVALLVTGIIHGESNHTLRRYAFEAVPALLQVILLLVLLKLRPGHPKSPLSLVASTVIWVAVSLAAWGVAGSLMYWRPAPGLRSYEWLFGVLAASLAVVLGALWWPNLVANRIVRWVGNGLALVLLALASVRTNDLSGGSSMYHWQFYVGPADLVRQGGWLLWDVPAQYGFLDELMIAWLPARSPWESLFILNSLACFLLAASVFFLLRRLGRGVFNLLMSFSLALVAVFIRPGFGSQYIGPIGYPSTGGFRFIWCVALLLILLLLLRVHSPRVRLALLIAGNLAWVAGVLWSAESAIYSSFVWLPGYLLVVIAERWNQPVLRRRLLGIAGLTALPSVFLAAALVVVYAVYEVGLGHPPDLFAFIEFGLAYQGGFGSYAIDPGGAGWVLFLTYIATLVTLAWNYRRQPKLASVVLVATAAMVYATSSYFVGRSHPNGVWNLAPQICIALAVTLAIAQRARQAEPLPVLLRLAAAPVLVMLLVAGLSAQAPVVDYLTRPQHDIARIDKALPATNPTLKDLLDAHIKPGDRVSFLSPESDPSLTPRLLTGLEQPDGSQQWLPLVPFSAVNILSPNRRTVYLDRFMVRHPGGGWLIERAGSQPDEEWVKWEIEKRLTPGPSYSNPDYVLTYWTVKGPTS